MGSGLPGKEDQARVESSSDQDKDLGVPGKKVERNNSYSEHIVQ